MGPLVRSGRLDLARRYFEENLDQEAAIYYAIESDDIATLHFLEPSIVALKSVTFSLKGGEEISYENAPFFTWLRLAFLTGSDQTIAYLTSLDPEYLGDTIIVDDILESLTSVRNERGIRLLHPFIEALVVEYPDRILELTEGNPTLNAYIQEHFL